MSLEEVRSCIDRIDSQVKDLLMERLDCSVQVVRAKQQQGSTQIFRPDREVQVLQRLGQGVPQDRLAPYLGVVRKVMETSRVYQYGILLEDDPDLFSQVAGCQLCSGSTSRVTVRATLPDRCGALWDVMSVMGDYGVEPERMVQEGASLQMVLKADASKPSVRTLLFQLARECSDFAVVACA
ncbi:MAG: chorismate mutase [Eggerthellaceae bacterium]